MNHPPVPGSGPLDSALLFLGEGPGPTEVKHGVPFVGMTGKFVRNVLKFAGMDPDCVRFNNAVPYRFKFPKDAAGKWKRMEPYLEHVDNDLARMGNLKVIVACGAVALQRLFPERHAITTAHGGVYVRGDHLVVPTLHPAGVMRTKLQAERMSIEKAITRAVKYATGELKYEPRVPEVEFAESAEHLQIFIGDSKTIVLDTEFDPNKRETFMLGLGTEERGPWHVMTVTREGLDEAKRTVLEKYLTDPGITKVAHFHQADVEALSWWGIDTTVPWFDTLAAFALLYPDLPVGLSHVARFMLDDVADWKWMDREDPRYNAIDVSNTLRILTCIQQDLADSGMWEVLQEEVFTVLPLLQGLQQRGLRVDKEELEDFRKSMAQESKTLSSNIATSADAVFERRKAPLTRGIEKHLLEIEAITTVVEDHRVSPIISPTTPYAGRVTTTGTSSTTSSPQSPPSPQKRSPGTSESSVGSTPLCLLHPKYNGMRKKKFASHEECVCRLVYEGEFVGKCRDRVAALRKEVTGAKTKLKRWERGFDPGNNDHVKWLLYDKDGLGLPVQKHWDTKKPTANATAVARLISLKTVARKKGAIELLQNIKRYQHVEKMLSTFLDPPIGEDGCIHPPYRIHGTGPGRPASGSDAFLSEKGVSQYKFNVLNIPHDARRIYIP